MDVSNERQPTASGVRGGQTPIKVDDEDPHYTTTAKNATADTLNPSQVKVNGQRKPSLLDLGKYFTVMPSKVEKEGLTRFDTPQKEVFRLWTRFPSHERAERSGSTAAKDGVTVRDFAVLRDSERESSQSAASPSPDKVNLRTQRSWKKLTFGKKGRLQKGKSKSMTLPRLNNGIDTVSSGKKSGRKGLAGRWKRLYRSNSLQIQAYKDDQVESKDSVRESISGCKVEDVANIRNAASNDTVRCLNMDGTADTAHLHQRETAGQSPTALGQTLAPLDSQPWTQMYRSCVGSLSALKSEGELGSLSESGVEDHVQDVEVRELTSESTTSFVIKLERTKEEARLKLIEQSEKMGTIGTSRK